MSIRQSEGSPISRVFLIGSILCVSAVGLNPPAVSAEDETEILKITVGEPTLLTPMVYQNSSAVAVSRTGAVVAFYPKPKVGAKFYRVSKDGGRTWGKELDYPPGYAGPMSVGLREGGVLFVWGARAVEGRRDQLEINRMIFSDDFLSWETETAKIHVPNYAVSLDVKYLSAAKGKILQLPDGDLLMPMYGGFEGDSPQKHRTILVRSMDQGSTWRYYATIDYTPEDPHPELPGHYLSSCEPSVALLPNGQMLAMLRTQYSHLPGEYRPMAVCRSDDLGKTWTEPATTQPHLMTISPTLQVLDNGVVACQYGRPGFHIAFSLDNGHAWQDRISFTHLPEPFLTGQFDMVKVGPNNLVAVGSDAQGTKAWPVRVERVKVPLVPVALEGLVLDEQGERIVDAIVERSPNRYYLDDWREHPTQLGPWKSTPLTIGSPVLGYRSIRKEEGHPTVRTDVQGRFRFESVKLGEYVLTVEADGHAPQHRHIKLGPDAQPQEFRLKAGRRVRGQVVDSTGRAVPGACVVLNRWHVHSDRAGFFHWSVESPLPEQVEIKVYKRYSSAYETLETTAPLSQFEHQPITLKKR